MGKHSESGYGQTPGDGELLDNMTSSWNDYPKPEIPSVVAADQGGSTPTSNPSADAAIVDKAYDK